MSTMKTFATKKACPTLLLGFALALGCASCSSDEKPEEKKIATTIKLNLTHPNYINGKLNVIAGGAPIALDPSSIVSVEPTQEYTLEFIADTSNEYFTFSADGVLTGIKEGDGNIEVRALASDGTKFGELIPVSVVGMLVTLTHRDYKNDTLTVGATATVVLTPETHLKVEPENPDYTITFVPKTTRYFTFTVEQNSRLTGVLDGTGTIEALVMRGSDTLKVQPFNVKVTPHPNWVKAVTVIGDKTMYVIKENAGKETQLQGFFTVTGGANQTLRYTSSNTNVATVDENTGVVIVNDVPDYAFIKATAVDGSQRADSIRVTTAWVRPHQSCDFNLCNILTDNNTKEDQRYVSCQVWDGDVATSWVYRMNNTFTRARYPGVQFLMGKYGKNLVDGDWNEGYPRCDWVLGCKEANGSDKVEKKETNWGVWSAGTQGGIVNFKKLVVTRGFYTDERGRKIFQSGKVYLELWYDDGQKVVMAPPHTFTDDPNDNEWVIDLTQGELDVWTYADIEANTTDAGKKERFPNGVPTTELQMMLSKEGANPAGDGYYYWAIADVLGFED